MTIKIIETPGGCPDRPEPDCSKYGYDDYEVGDTFACTYQSGNEWALWVGFSVIARVFCANGKVTGLNIGPSHIYFQAGANGPWLCGEDIPNENECGVDAFCFHGGTVRVICPV